MKAIIDVYYRQGDLVKAASRLEGFRSFLHQELGIAPGKVMHALEMKLYDQDK
jgi:DNA-binding SARP family transcriptional activator